LIRKIRARFGIEEASGANRDGLRLRRLRDGEGCDQEEGYPNVFRKHG
jgi:hypothetical protein